MGAELARPSPLRRALCGAGLAIFFVSAWETKQMSVFLNISLISYLDRPIYDVKMNGTDFMGAVAHGFYGSNDVMIMQPLTLGPQVVTWKLAGPEGMSRNGELVTAKNKPVFNEVPVGVKWLALHIYDDDTVEIKLSKGTPNELESKRGQKIIKAWESKNGR
jgi:hypothetical protein